MTRLITISALCALAAGLVAASAPAKGASGATITGPGLPPNGITLAGEGDVGGEQLMRIADAAGFFPAVFLRTPNPMLSSRPQGELGPRYAVTYVMPGPDGEDELRQDLYPYAEPSPVTYVAPGQAFFGTERTVGGWYVASSELKDPLVAAGLPTTAPSSGHGFEIPWVLVGLATLAAAALAVIAVRARSGRRRSKPATA